MAYARDTLPIVDEDGNSALDTLDDHDFGLATTTPAIDQSAANADHLVFAGMGVPRQCCDILVTPTAAVHEQEPDTSFEEIQSCPRLRPIPIHNSYSATPATQHQPPQTVQENPDTSLDARAPAFVPAQVRGGNTGQANRPLVFHNTTPGVTADQLRVRATPATSLARSALRALDELNPTRAGGSFGYPLTGPDRFPGSSLEFIQEHSYNPGMGHGGSHVARNDRRPSVASSRGSTRSAATQGSLAGSLECRYCPGKRNGEPFPTVGERNKHERHVHGPKQHRPHACHVCGARFNYPREVCRHLDAMHSDVPATAVCPICSNSSKHRMDHLDRHLKIAHPFEWPAIKEARKSKKRSVNSSDVAGPMTPSTPSVNTSSNGFGLLTPPPSRGSYRGSYRSEFPPLPPSPSRT